jgi:hypothetical protein
MTELTFAIQGAVPDRMALTPSLVFDLRVETTSKHAIQGLSLSCQIQIEPNRRAHAPGEVPRLTELFGEEARWGQTLRPFVWGRSTVASGPFRGSCKIELPVSCSYDLELAAAKYFHALDSGDIPLLFLFSGTIYSTNEDGGLAIERISWECDARYRLPLATWRALMDGHWPDSGWLRLDRNTIDALLQFKARRSLPTWDGTMKALLDAAETDGAVR